MITDIVFDFGNVLYQLDIEGCHKRLADLCGLSVDDFLSKLNPIIARYEKGEIGDENFIWHLQQYNPTLNPREFVKAWNSMLIGIDRKVPQLLHNLSAKYHLHILSNINGLHARRVDRHLHKVLNEPHFLTHYFKQYFFSHLIHLRKPDVEIYQYVTQQIGCSPESILFIDDNKENVNAAIEFGWNGKWHNPQTPLFDCMDQYLTD